MNTEQVWEILGQIPVGHVVAWGAVICSVVFSVYKAITKLYSFFAKYRSMKEENERQTKLLNEHDELLNEIKESLNEQKEVNLKQIRHAIVDTCDSALSAGYITAWKLKSLEEMFEEYTVVFNGNGYVKTLIEKTRALPIHGKLDG